MYDCSNIRKFTTKKIHVFTTKKKNARLQQTINRQKIEKKATTICDPPSKKVPQVGKEKLELKAKM